MALLTQEYIRHTHRRAFRLPICPGAHPPHADVAQRTRKLIGAIAGRGSSGFAWGDTRDRNPAMTLHFEWVLEGGQFEIGPIG
jgi:hypothetical protein